MDLRRTFPDLASFEAAWNVPARRPGGRDTVPEIAYFVGGGLSHEGFRLFHNGGLPLLERRRGPLREEIVFLTTPDGEGLTARFHLSHSGVGEVRGRYWRPAIRAPKVVARGDVGLLEPIPVRAIWSAMGLARTGEALLRTMKNHVLPWFDAFDDPSVLRERLREGDLPLIDASTAVELMLAEFDEREARRFLRSKVDALALRVVAPEIQGFDLATDRVAAIAAYYHL